MDNEIRSCFCLYLHYMKSNIKNLQDYDIQNMTISQIKAQLEFVHMQYILTTSSYSLSETAPAIVAYKHLKQMIEGDHISLKYQKLESDIKCLTLENEILKRELNDFKNKMSNVLFPSSPITEPQISTNTDQPKRWFF